ncbi:MAG: WbqC family protein [Bacteroidales bacterium]|jgi:hypothetical protein
MPVLLTTAYLPPISYIAGCLCSNQIIIERFETYPKQTFRNRCNIYGPNGLQKLSIPVVKVNGNHTQTKDIRISQNIPWKRIHWRSIETAYNNSPFFLYYKDLFIKTFEKQFDFLIDHNTHLLITILEILKIEYGIGFSDHFIKNPEGIIDLQGFSSKKNHHTSNAFPHYTQVFSPIHGFLADLSIIDLIFNLGPEAEDFLVSEINPTFVSR